MITKISRQQMNKDTKFGYQLLNDGEYTGAYNYVQFLDEEGRSLSPSYIREVESMKRQVFQSKHVFNEEFEKMESRRCQKKLKNELIKFLQTSKSVFDMFFLMLSVSKTQIKPDNSFACPYVDCFVYEISERTLLEESTTAKPQWKFPLTIITTAKNKDEFDSADKKDCFYVDQRTPWVIFLKTCQCAQTISNEELVCDVCDSLSSDYVSIGDYCGDVLMNKQYGEEMSQLITTASNRISSGLTIEAARNAVQAVQSQSSEEGKQEDKETLQLEEVELDELVSESDEE